MTKRLPIVRNDGHTWGRHSTSFDAIRMSFGHSTVIPNANLDCFFLPFLVNRRGRYASKWRRFSFQGNSTGDPREGSLSSFLVIPRDQTASKWRSFSFGGQSIGDQGKGLSRRSSSFHETKLHPNDGHFHLVVNPSAIKGKGLHVHLVHKSMILQSGPFLVLEPQKYTCLPASFGHEKSQFLRRLKLTNQNINKFAGSFCQHNCYILGLFRLTKPKKTKNT